MTSSGYFFTVTVTWLMGGMTWLTAETISLVVCESLLKVELPIFIGYVSAPSCSIPSLEKATTSPCQALSWPASGLDQAKLLKTKRQAIEIHWTMFPCITPKTMRIYSIWIYLDKQDYIILLILHEYLVSPRPNLTGVFFFDCFPYETGALSGSHHHGGPFPPPTPRPCSCISCKTRATWTDEAVSSSGWNDQKNGLIIYIYRKGFDEDEMEHNNKIGKGRKLY